MEPAILAIHDFAPTVVGPTEPDRAATASAHDGTRSQDHPQLHQQAQNVLNNDRDLDSDRLSCLVSLRVQRMNVTPRAMRFQRRKLDCDLFKREQQRQLLVESCIAA